MDTRDVPHGDIAEVTYGSASPNRFRRLHVYTPPGGESGDTRYPVFHLLHGATGKDDFLVETSRRTVEMLKGQQFPVGCRERDGAPTWDRWREYLNEFAPQLFR